jgi:hypothetical protein
MSDPFSRVNTPRGADGALIGHAFCGEAGQPGGGVDERAARRPPYPTFPVKAILTPFAGACAHFGLVKGFGALLPINGL